MIPCFTFVAYSNTGKTTYIERLIAELRRRGLRVGALKHDAHDFALDTPGKDTYRFAAAGAEVVAIGSDTHSAVMEYRPLGFAELVSRIKGVDLILVEGWHSESENKICLWRSDCGKPMKLDPSQCLAVVCDIAPEGCAVPVFPLGDPAPMADFLENRLRGGEKKP